MTFGGEVARVYGVKTEWIDAVFVLILAVALIASMLILGVTLIAAALVIPAITARLLTDSFDRMMLLSVFMGAVSGFIGMYLSFYIGIASGASIVLLQALLFSLALVVTLIRQRAARRLIHTHM
jgi:ABC-type Mn2+/Zn2+ transport system permease subunit